MCYLFRKPHRGTSENSHLLFIPCAVSRDVSPVIASATAEDETLKRAAKEGGMALY